jgi:hypothetical protein
VNTYGEPGSTHSSSRVRRCIVADGKPTTVSKRNSARATSYAPERFAQLVPFNRDTSLLLLQPRRGCFAALCDCPAWTKSTIHTLPNGTAIALLGHLALKSLHLHELPSAASYRPLTRARSAGYAGIQKGGSRYVDSAATASCSVPGALDNQGERTRVLTSSSQSRGIAFCAIQAGRFPDQLCPELVDLREARGCSVQTRAAHTWRLWAFDGNAPDAKPITRHCRRNPYRFPIAFSRTSCTPLRGTPSVAGFLRFRPPETVNESALIQELGAA